MYFLIFSPFALHEQGHLSPVRSNLFAFFVFRFQLVFSNLQYPLLYAQSIKKLCHEASRGVPRNNATSTEKNPKQQLRFAGIHGNLGQLMLHEVNGALYFTSDIRVAVGVQSRWCLD